MRSIFIYMGPSSRLRVRWLIVLSYVTSRGSIAIVIYGHAFKDQPMVFADVRCCMLFRLVIFRYMSNINGWFFRSSFIVALPRYHVSKCASALFSIIVLCLGGTFWRSRSLTCQGIISISGLSYSWFKGSVQSHVCMVAFVERVWCQAKASLPWSSCVVPCGGKVERCGPVRSKAICLCVTH